MTLLTMPKSVISQNIQRLLKEKDWNETELARYAQVEQSTVHRIASGVTENPRTDSVKKIAKAFNVSYSELTSPSEFSGTAEPGTEYPQLPAGAKKLIATIHALADQDIGHEDYLILCKLLERFSKKQ